jgi:phosphate starvation-inducible protein PhoH and related proteins
VEDLQPVKKKKVLKNPIKFHIPLTDEQKSAKSVILENKITILKGAAGSGKTMVAAQIALDLLFRGEVEKVILSRPAVAAGEELGFMPGDKDQKLAPYTAAVYDNMFRLYHRDKVEKEIQEGRIEVIPVAFMRSRNFSNCFVVVDEGQNMTHVQMELLLSRMCTGSKMVICGDSAQIDLKDKKQSGFKFVCDNFKTIPGFQVVTLQTNHRDPIVEEILKIYNEHRN